MRLSRRLSQDRRGGTSSGKRLVLTGNLTVDAAIERHQHVEQTARSVGTTVAAFLQETRKFSETSAAATRSLQNYYAGSGGESRLRAFGQAHEKVDADIPNNLLAIAQEHITARVDSYLNTLTDVKEEIRVFKEKQSLYDHYVKKVSKMEEEQRRRASDGKPEKPKQIEKMTRNQKKLNESRQARDEMVTALVNKLNYLYETRISTMDPIFKFVFQFQQEYFRQCSEALSISLPEVDSSVDVASNATTPIAQVPSPVNTRFQYDGHGNRIGSPESAPASGMSNNSGSYATIPEAEATSHGHHDHNGTGSFGQVNRPPQPPRSSHSGINIVNTDQNQARSQSSSTSTADDDSLVDKWFSV